MNSLLINSNGVQMPQLGLGVWEIPDDQAEETVALALRTGYRSIDTAAAYGNETGVGRGIRASGVPRERIFVTSKLWNSDHTRVEEAFEESLGRLGLDYLDMYLIHWPVPAQDRYVQAWKVLEKLQESGRVRAIGVCNFTIEHLRRLLAEATISPAVNQIELHPYLQQRALRAFHDANGIATEAWSPLGHGQGLLLDPALGALADKHGRSPAQIVLRWHIQLDNIVIPKSVTPAWIEANINVFDFTLDPEDMAAIGALNSETRLGPDPDTFNVMI